MIEISVAGLSLCVSFLVGYYLRGRFSGWRPIWIAVLGALPIPIVIWALCAVLFIRASTASSQQCGIDACGMAIMGAMFVSGFAFLLFLLNLAASAVGSHIASRRITRPNIPDVFE